jgi:hypothetical protein
MSTSAVILRFPSGEPVIPPEDQGPTETSRTWQRWLGGVVALAVVVTTAIGAFVHPSSRASLPPNAPTLAGAQSVVAVDRICKSHPGAIYRGTVRGVFYSGLALQGVSGALFDSGPLPAAVIITPGMYADVPAYQRLVTVPWPDHDKELKTGYWMEMSGVLSCVNPVQLAYLTVTAAAG